MTCHKGPWSDLNRDTMGLKPLNHQDPPNSPKSDLLCMTFRTRRGQNLVYDWTVYVTLEGFSFEMTGRESGGTRPTDEGTPLVGLQPTDVMDV